MSDCRVVQMVRTSDENYLFIVGFDGEHNISIEMSAK